MAFDQPTRNRLQKFVSDTRTLLSEEFTRQLQHEYGLDPATGDAAELDSLRHLDDSRRETARLLRETLEHYQASAPSGTLADMMERIVREQAFTVLNRLCALRMAEARGLLRESVGSGYTSKGFQLYARLAGTALGETGDTYRCYLFSLFDEFAVDLPVLFDRYAPMGRLFPREAVLLAVLENMNAPDIAFLWTEDETIGWIYQYFNSIEERRQMRKESQAPRNSRELAVRNQFFTPRYVVEFLTDNTLGRIWYEMMQGNTSLKDTCRYLVRRPNEIFLQTGEDAPSQFSGNVCHCEESATKQSPDTREIASQSLAMTTPSRENITDGMGLPVYIPFRPLKDPRDIRMLDPACGSMHFGLYAFDLFERIYEEAWELEEMEPNNEHVIARSLRRSNPVPGASSQSQRDGFAKPRHDTFRPLHDLYASKDEFLRDVPRLIIEHNIHGVDIDPRAAQIAGLSLWLRAQRSWQRQGVKPAERPEIRKSNIVCAEPMPGEKAMLQEFADSLQPKVLGQLVDRIFDKMQLAGEAGSLLKIEKEIEEAVTHAREEFNKELLRRRQAEQELFPDQFGPKQTSLFDFADLPDKTTFWNTAVQKILDALQSYAEQAESIDASRRRLFTDDAAKGFAFIELCRKRFDVVLMNPPFGVASKPSRKYIDKKYSSSKNDLYASFIECSLKRIAFFGILGAITSRTGFFLSSFQKWREEVILNKFSPTVFADLGMGVLDTAMVETAAYCLSAQGNSEDSLFFRLLSSADKDSELSKSIENLNNSYKVDNVYSVLAKSFQKVPGSPLAYWVNDNIQQIFEELPSFEPRAGIARVGLATGDDFRFIKAAWEIPYESIRRTEAPTERWVPLAKGGEYSKFYSDLYLMVDWQKEGEPIEVSFAGARIKKSYYFKPGVTWTYRSDKGFSVRNKPTGSIHGSVGHSAFVTTENLNWILAWLNSYFVSEVLLRMLTTYKWEVGFVRLLPIPNITEIDKDKLADLAQSSIGIKRNLIVFNELSHIFQHPITVRILRDSLAESISLWHKKLIEFDSKISEYQHEIDKIVLKSYNIEKLPQDIVEQHSLSETNEVDDTEKDIIGKSTYIFDLLSYFLGGTFARWDIRYATGDKQPPELPDPFAPLPVCPPGMLQNADGLPAEPQDVSEDYPLRITWNGILVDDEGHPEDIVARVREALEVIWHKNAGDIEQEACEILGVKTLRDYFGTPNKFFADHLKRYSKSRRQAPIYWPLSTASGSYTLWIYYHRLSDQALYTCVNDYVEPKLKHVADTLADLGRKPDRSRQEEKTLEQLTDLERELQDFRDELLRIAAFWKPNLNDGVQITAAPLWKLFKLSKWQKTLKQIWGKLEKGDYDWTHLAYSIWPERVIRASHKDRSYAIAHNLEETLWEEVDTTDKRGKPKTKWQPRTLSEEEIHRIIQQKTSSGGA